MNHFSLVCGTLSGSGRQDDGCVNQFRERRQRRRESCQKRLWNRLRLGAPRMMARNRDTDRDASSTKHWGYTQGSGSQPTTGEISLRREDGSPSATLQEKKIGVREQRVRKPLISKPPP